MKKKVIIVATAAAASMLLATPAMAKEFKTEDGNITIELPGDDWHEVIDPEAEFVFTNGVDVISAEKFDPDEKVEIVRNDDYYNAVLQLSYAYGDQLIVLTAQVADAPHLAEVYEAITSIKFSGISANNEAKKDVSNYVISDTDMTMYVNAAEGLNLRENFSVNSAVLTTIPNTSAVHVTGIVKLDDKEIGWYRVEFDGQTGYVSSANLVAEEGSITNKPRTFEEIASKVLYYDTMYLADGTPVKVACLNDGTRLDMNGYSVVGFADGACQMYDGTIIYEFNPTEMSLDEWLNGYDTSEAQSNLQNITSYTTLYYGDGTPVQVGVLSDGYSLVDMDGRSIAGYAEDAYQTSDGAILYINNPVTYEPQEEPSQSTAWETLTSENGVSTIISQEEDGNWYDSAGNEYWENEAGIWFNESDYSEWYN